MMNEFQGLIDDYCRWLRNNIVLRQLENCIEITTPYLDRHNDHLQIYVKRDGDGFTLTDGGYIVDDLQMSGCELESKKRKELLQITLNGFGIGLKDGVLSVNAFADNFSHKKHSLIQAMLAVNDMFYLATPFVSSLFWEDVSDWLNVHDVRCTPRIKFAGKSGYDHLFDFVVPASRKYPERILQTINRPNKDFAKSLAFAWIDTKNTRPVNSVAYAFLNDAEQSPSSDVLSALRNYGVTPVPWSKRETVREEIAA